MEEYDESLMMEENRSLLMEEEDNSNNLNQKNQIHGNANTVLVSGLETHSAPMIIVSPNMFYPSSCKY